MNSTIAGPSTSEPSPILSLSYTGTSSQYAYSAEDHSGQKTTPNPLAIMQFKGGAEPEIMYQPEAG